MSHENLTDLIRRSIRQLFERAGAPPNQPIRETFLIRGGYFCGRRFRCGDLSAVWFIDENQIKLYGPNGQLLAVHNVQQSIPAAA